MPLKFAGCAALLALGLNAVAETYTATDQASLNTALSSAKSGDVVQITEAGEYAVQTLGGAGYTLESVVTGEDGKVDTSKVVLKHTAGDHAWVANCSGMVTVKNLTWDYGTAGYQYFQNVRAVGCVLKGLICGHTENYFENCTFIQTAKDYIMWTYSANVTYDGCTFINEAYGKALNVYNEGLSNKNIVIKNCKFVNKGSLKKVAVFVKTEIPNTDPAVPLHFNVAMSGCTLEGNWPKDNSEREDPENQDPMGANGLWGIEGKDWSDKGAIVTIRVNGLEVYPHEEKPEIKIEEVAENTDKGITQDVADEINNNAAVKEIVQSGVNDALANIDPAGEAVVKVQLEKVEKAADEAQTPTLTFEVAPYVGDIMVENVNQKLNGKKVTVVLPLTKAFTVSAIVTHAGDPDRLLPVLGLPDNPYVQFETTHFSLFGVTLSNMKVSSTTTDAKTVLGIKRVKEMAKSVDTAAAVPWLGTAGSNCKVSDLITTGLAMGDTIKVYDLATKDYFVWVVDKDGKTWVKVDGAPASQPEAHEYTLARGRAFWYMKDGGNESVEYTQVGTYDVDQIQTATDKGGASAPVHNLLINPKWADFNVSQSLVDGATDGDQIVIVDSKLRYQFKVVDAVGKWGTIQPTTKTVTIGGVERTVRGPDQFVPVATDLVIPAGKAFWYISKGGEPTVKW